MSIFGTPPPVANSLAGADAAERLSAREKAREARSPAASKPKSEDADTVEVHGPEAIDPARRLAKSGDEDAQQDRRQSGSEYRPPRVEDDPGPSIDVQG